MKQGFKKIELIKLAGDAKNLIRGMAKELEGVAADKPSCKPRWGARFIAAGPKNAPSRR
jgi:hypothetical protein